MELKFPAGFLWGTATAAHQVEGNNALSDYWLFEHLPASEFDEPSGIACDHYNRYRSDIALLKDFGFNAFRFSIEWARIEPRRGEFDTAEIEHYRDVLRTCHESGITPIVTLQHFTSPQWLIAQGGWGSAKTPAYFGNYARRITEELGDLMTFVCTMNEVNGGRITNATGIFGSIDDRRKAAWVQQAARQLGMSPSDFTPWNFACEERHINVIRNAHREAVRNIRDINTDIKVGLTIASQEITPTPGCEEVAERVHHDIERCFFDAVKDDDFIGVQSYTRWEVDCSAALRPFPDANMTQMGYEVRPEALAACIRHTASKTGLPVLITENGIGTDDDNQRIAFLQEALIGVMECIKDNINVLGYTYWTALDNFEWEFGYKKHFGLIAVDRNSQERIPKPSATWLGNVAKNNALHIDEVRKDPENPGTKIGAVR